MSRLTKNILMAVLSVPGLNPAVRWVLRASSPKSAHASNSDLPEIVNKDADSALGILRRIIPLSDQLSFSPGNGYYFGLKGLNSSNITRLIYWHGMAPMDFYPGSVVWKLVSNATSIIDVGANIGLYSLCFQQASPKANIVAFEPAPSVFQTLKSNIALNHSEIAIYPYAITDFCGEITLYIPPTECDASTRDSLPDEADTLNIPYTKITVPAYTLDSLLSELNIDQVDFVKLDTEGTEPAVMRGMKGILERHKPDIFCEIVDGTKTEKELEDLLKPYHYNYYQLMEGELVRVDSIIADVNKKYLNFLFSQKNLVV